MILMIFHAHITTAEEARKFVIQSSLLLPKLAWNITILNTFRTSDAYIRAM